jgi:hypothetical protein
MGLEGLKMNLKIAKILIIILSVFTTIVIGLFVYVLFVKKYVVLDGSAKLKNTIFYEPLKGMGILPKKLYLGRWLKSLFTKKSVGSGILDYFELK